MKHHGGLSQCQSAPFSNLIQQQIDNAHLVYMPLVYTQSYFLLHFLQERQHSVLLKHIMHRQNTRCFIKTIDFWEIL